VPRIHLEDLDSQEREIVTEVLEAGHRADIGENSFSEEILAIDWLPSGQGEAIGRFELRTEFLNRKHGLSGGVAFGLAAAASVRATDHRLRVAQGSIYYLRAASGATARVRAQVLRHGSRAAFTEATIETNGTAAAVATFMLVSSSPRASTSSS
jgi:acyl-coenzyme A thioesterase PaaI-like protein